MPSWGIALTPPACPWPAGPASHRASASTRVRAVARQDNDARFTALLHVDVDRLRAAFWALNPKATFPVRDAGVPSYGAQSHGVDNGGHMAATSSKLPGAHSVASSPGLAKMGVIRIDAIFQAPFALRYSSV